jgi:hypothetical protein
MPFMPIPIGSGVGFGWNVRSIQADNRHSHHSTFQRTGQGEATTSPSLSAPAFRVSPRRRPVLFEADPSVPCTGCQGQRCIFGLSPPHPAGRGKRNPYTRRCQKLVGPDSSLSVLVGNQINHGSRRRPVRGGSSVMRRFLYAHSQVFSASRRLAAFPRMNPSNADFGGLDRTPFPDLGFVFVSYYHGSTRRSFQWQPSIRFPARHFIVKEPLPHLRGILLPIARPGASWSVLGQFQRLANRRPMLPA